MASAPDNQSEAGSDVSDWEVEEGLPQFEDQFIQKYFQGREALIDQEKSQRSDAAFRQSLTPLATEACQIVSRILAEEHQTIWTGKFQDELARQEGVNLHPGMMFALARDTMEKTKSWQIVKKMPKGALLHAHQDAMIDVDWLIDEVLGTEGMAMFAEESLCDPTARAKGEVVFRYSKGSLAKAPSIWSKEYQTSHPVSMKEAAASFPDGATEGFKKWLKSRCTVTPEESIKHHHGLDAVWRKFRSCFPLLDSMEYYEPILRASMQRLLRQLVDDGLRWVDFRLTFPVVFRLDGCEESSQQPDDLVRVFSEELKKFKATEEGKDFWGYRFIWTSLRSWGKKRIVDHMKQCIHMKKAYPELIAGYDVVGQEDMGRSLADLTPELFWFKKRCFENGVDMYVFLGVFFPKKFRSWSHTTLGFGEQRRLVNLEPRLLTAICNLRRSTDMNHATVHFSFMQANVWEMVMKRTKTFLMPYSSGPEGLATAFRYISIRC